MNIKEKLSEQYQIIKNKITNDPTYQNIDEKWQQLEVKDKKKVIHLTFLSFIAITSCVLIFTLIYVSQYNATLSEKQSIITMIKNFKDMSEVSKKFSFNTTDIKKQIDSTALYANIPANQILLDEDSTNNSVLIKIQKINLKQLLQFTVKLEDTLIRSWINNLSIETDQTVPGSLKLEINLNSLI